MKRSLILAAAALAFATVPALSATYTLDKDHTHPSFEFSHMGISVWRGTFARSSGRVTLDREAHTGTVQVVVNTDSIDFAHKAMNEIAITADWLNIEWHPTMNYQGTLRFQGDTPVAVDGQLTLLGITRALVLKIDSFKCIQHPLFKKEVCGADAEGEFNRADYGMKLYSDGEAGKIRLHIQVEALKD